MFESAPLNPPDSIFGLIADFRADKNPDKVNLTVGVYQDESGITPVMDCVRAAEQRLLESRGSKSYLPIDGSTEYQDAIGRLILGEDLFGGDACFSASAHTPGGTVALRVAGELLRSVFGVESIWMSDPTWANHPKIYAAAGLEVVSYDYLDDHGTGFSLQKMLDSLQKAPAGSAVLLHTVCHNPTGVDPNPDEWETILELIQNNGLLPVFDFAYQGFGENLELDAMPIRKYIQSGGEALICNSFSKNFGLYAERVGGITAVCRSQDAAVAMQSQIKSIIRTMYSNPPLHGGAIVATILNDSELRNRWMVELEEIRQRITRLRASFVSAMQSRVPDCDFEFINRQRGMFSYSGIAGEQARFLREKHSIYFVE